MLDSAAHFYESYRTKDNKFLSVYVLPMPHDEYDAVMLLCCCAVESIYSCAKRGSCFCFRTLVLAHSLRCVSFTSSVQGCTSYAPPLN